MDIRDNYRRLLDDVARAARGAGRSPEDVAVMAVSKTRTAEEVRLAGEAGLALFGENRVDEAAGKFAALPPERYPLYLIGHLQGNKAGRIGPRFAGVHSVDSVKLARRLSEHRAALGVPLEVLLQVNTSGEASKSGFGDRGEFREAAALAAELPALVLRGVMTMAPFTDDERAVRDCFAACRRWCGDIASLIEGEPVLSMGMTSDFRLAVAEGSTLVRVGTALFGGRS